MDYPTPLVSAQWLKTHLTEPHLRIVDVRFSLSDPSAGYSEYRAGHIPGAVFMDLEYDLAAPKKPGGIGGRHPKPEPEVLAKKLGSLGIGNEHFVVAYDDPPAGGMYAPHLWWLLRWLGHDRVAVLDGGLGAWIEGGGSLTQDTPNHPRTTFTPNPRPTMLLDAQAVQNRPASSVLVDSRAPVRYRGEQEPLDPVAGHIPGAINRDWSEGLEPGGRFRDAQAQQARFAGLTGPEDEVIVYCGSGVSAAANALALELAGHKNVKLYGGSWSDWVSDPSRPVATGEE